MIKGINQTAKVDQVKRESVKNADRNIKGQEATDKALESDKIDIAKANGIAEEIASQAADRIGDYNEAENVVREILPLEANAIEIQGNISNKSAENLIIA